MINRPTKIIVELGDNYSDTIDIAFSAKRSNDRKKWLQKGD